MKPSLIARTISERFTNGVMRPVILEGAPGLGKTQIMKQIADQLGVEFQCLHAPLMQPEDWGMPVVNATKDGIKFIVPTEKLPIEGSEFGDSGILVIDELPQAENSIQKIVANLMQEREIHGKKLKPGWLIVATGNRSADRAGANRLLSHLRNRCTTIEFTPDLDDWCSWYMGTENFKPECLGFIRFRSGLLSAFDPQQEISPTPRGWTEGVFASLGNVPSECEYEVFKGDVGEGAATEFMAYMKIFRNLPDIDTLLKNPLKANVPTEAAVLYALSSTLAHHANAKNFADVLAYTKRMPSEYLLIMVRGVSHKVEITRTKAYSDWIQTEGPKLLS